MFVMKAPDARPGGQKGESGYSCTRRDFLPVMVDMPTARGTFYHSHDRNARERGSRSVVCTFAYSPPQNHRSLRWPSRLEL